MSTIIAGRFQQQDQVAKAIAALADAEFPADQISSFFVNPAGQHDIFPIGGDRDKSPGAEHSEKGMFAGGAVGAAVGVATTPLIGPAGPVAGALLGAYLGSLVGTLSQMEEADQTPPLRHSGMLVAVAVSDALREAQAIDILQALDPLDLERAQGTIADGDWKDFDPLRAPGLLDGKPAEKM